MMKKLLSIALSLCMLLTMFSSITVLADVEPDIVAEVVTSNEGDGSFTITFYSTSEKVEAFGVTVNFDATKYTLTTTKKSAVFNSALEGTTSLNAQETKILFNWFSTYGGLKDKNTYNEDEDTYESLAPAANGMYEIAHISFTLNKEALIDADYENKLKINFEDYSFAAPTDTVPTVTYVEFNIPDTRTEIAGLSLEGKEVPYNGEVVEAVVTGADDKTTVEYKINGGDVTEIKDAGTYTVEATAKKAGYKPTVLTATVVVNKKPVTLTVDGASKVYGEANPTVYTAKVEGLVGADTLAYTVARAEGEDVGTYAITATIGENKNYEVTTNTPAKFTITKKPVTVTVVAAGKVFGEEDPELKANVEGLIGTDTLNYTVARAEEEDVGTYVITATIGENKNYEVTTNTPAEFNITKAPYNGDAVVVAKNVMINKDKAYEVDMTSAISAIKEAAVVSAEILVDGTILSNVTTEENVVKFDIESYATETENIASIKVVVSSKNYENFDATINLSTVDKEELTISGVTVADKTYDAVAVAPDKSGLTVTGATEVPFDNETLVYTYEGTGETVYSSTEAPVNAGTYNLVVSVPEENEYYAGSLTVPFEIAKKEVTITIADAHKKYEEKDPELTATVDTTVNGEELAYTLSRAEGEDVGSYAITAKLGENPNYEVKVVDGTFTIKQKDIELKLIEDALIITYGEKVPEIKTDAPEGVNIIFETIEDPTVGEYNVKVTDIESKNYNVTNKDSIVCKLTVDAKEITIDSLNLEEKTVAFAEGDIVNGDAITLDFEQLDVVVDFESEKATVKNFVLKDEKENEVRSENYVVATEALEVDVTIPEIAEEAAEGTVQEGVEATVKAIEGAKAIILETLTVGDVADGTTVSLDATKVDALVETISIAIDIVKDLKDKADLAVTLSEAAISFDKSALSAIAEGNAFVLKAAEYDESLLSEKQAEATKELNNAKVFSFNINDGGFDFGEGKVNVTVDFENTKNETVRAKYLKDDGTTEDVKVSYVDGKATLEISHFSEYVIYTARVSGGRPSGAGSVIRPATGGSTTKPEDDKKDDETGKPVASASIALKEKAEEIKFIEGYEDKTFRPDSNATRNDVVSALTALFDITDVENAPSFGDTDDKAIKDLAAAGVINGYEDGTFKGHNDVTRAEFVKLVAAALKLETVEGATANFSDIEGHWAIEWIKTFVNKGYLVGYPDGTFRPEDKITRAEMVVVMTRVAGTVADADAIVNYADVDDAHWAYDYIMKAAK